VGDAKSRWVEVFDRAAAEYDRDEPRLFSDVARRLVRHAGVTAGDRVLDVSTGPGVVLLQAAELAGPAGSLTGVDLNAAMAGEARRRLREAGVRGEVVRSDADRLGLAGGSFDVALSSNGWFAPDEMLRVLLAAACLLHWRPEALFGAARRAAQAGSTWSSGAVLPRGRASKTCRLVASHTAAAAVSSTATAPRPMAARGPYCCATQPTMGAPMGVVPMKTTE